MERGRDVICTKSRSYYLLLFLLYVGFAYKQRRTSRTQPSSTATLLGQFQRGKNKGDYLRNVWICWAWYKRRWTVSLSLETYLKRNFQPSEERWEAAEACYWASWFSIAPELNAVQSLLFSQPFLIHWILTIPSAFVSCLDWRFFKASTVRALLCFYSPAGSHCCLALRQCWWQHIHQKRYFPSI